MFFLFGVFELFIKCEILVKVREVYRERLDFFERFKVELGKVLNIFIFYC